MPWLASNWFPPSWYGESGGGGAALIGEIYEGIDVLSAIETWWDSNEDVQLFSADKHLWHMVAPQGALLPYATFFLVSEMVETWTTAYPFWRDAIQINCHASTDISARAAAMTIRDELKGAILSIDGSNICHCLPTQTGMQIGQKLGPRGEDCWIAFVTFDICWTP